MRARSGSVPPLDLRVNKKEDAGKDERGDDVMLRSGRPYVCNYCKYLT